MKSPIEDEKNSSRNSFLVETTFNSDIGLEVRKEIEEKFKNSKSNQSYVFPRNQNQQTSLFNQSKRNYSNFRSKNRSIRLDISSKQQEIMKIYSREQTILKQMYRNI